MTGPRQRSGGRRTSGRGRAFGWTALLVFGACSDPAALDVVVAINAQSLSELRLILRDGGLASEAFVDCRLPFAAPASDCRLEGGTGAWDDEDRFAFVLYGDPGAQVGLEIEGLSSGQSVTATRAVVVLPDAAGGRGRIDLALFDRTEVRRRCMVDIQVQRNDLEPSTSPQVETALTAIDLNSRPGLELLLSVDGELLVATYAPQDDACTLTTVELRDPVGNAQGPFGEDRWCRVHTGALVADRLANDSGFVAASLCARVGSAGARLKVATITAQGVDISTVNLEVPLAQVSMPQLVDFDGNGGREVVVLVQTAVPEPAALVRVLRYEPLTARTGFRDVGGFGFLGRGQPGLPPLVFAGPVRGERLLIAGYLGPVGVFDGRDFEANRPPDQRAQRAPVLVDVDAQPQLQELRGDRFSSTRFALTGAGGNAVWQAVVTASAALPRSVVAIDDLRRLSIGQTSGGSPVVAVAVDGAVIGWAIGPQAEVTTIASDGFAEEQELLHVNLDGQPGTELVAYTANANAIRGIDQTGEPLTGWPIDLMGEGGVRRVLMTDLEATRDDRALRSAELVGLTYRRLEAISLGAGSYDSSEWPWPSSDGGARGRWTGPTDPLRR